MALASLTAYLGFQSSMPQLRNQTLGMLRTYLSSPLTNVLYLSDPSVAERLHYVRPHFLPHPHRLQCHTHPHLSPRWNTLLATRGPRPERSHRHLQFGFKVCFLCQSEHLPPLFLPHCLLRHNLCILLRICHDLFGHILVSSLLVDLQPHASSPVFCSRTVTFLSSPSPVVVNR